MFLDPQEAFEHLRASTIEGIQSNFPIKAGQRSLHVENIVVDDKLHADDIHSQYEAKTQGKSWTVPVNATLVLKDADGKVLERKTTRLCELPKMTRRYSYIVNGQEYQVDNQWQLKPGVYSRRRNNGELEGRFNVAGATAFDMIFDPSTKVFKTDIKKAKIPTYGLLSALGVSDDDMKASWGESVFTANKNAARSAGAPEQFFKTMTGKSAADRDEAVAFLKKHMANSKLRPEVTERTLGKPFEHATGEAMLLTGAKLLKVQQGHPEDDRDDLEFKTLRSTGDFVKEQLQRSGKLAALKMQRQIGSAGFRTLKDLNAFGVFNAPIRQFFLKSSISNPAKQINPLEMVSAAMQTTIMGPGGIQSEESVTPEAKMINQSHLGFLDPLNTPEGSKTGVTLRLPAGVKRLDNGDIGVPVVNLKTMKTEYINPSVFSRSKVVLADQLDYSSGKPVPLKSVVKMAGNKNEIIEGKFEDADYALRHSSQIFNLTSNLIPFLPNDSGNRSSMASRHMEQAISLIHREAPLVQVGTPTPDGKVKTFEQFMGLQTSHHAPAAGTITRVAPGAVHIKSDDGTTHTVQVYNNYPLNDAKSVLHSTLQPNIKEGAKVKAGQLIADTNYSKNGDLALGRSMRIAFVPYKGYNFEDGVVISESASKMLSSEHMHKHDFETNERVVHDPKFFRTAHMGLFNPDQLDKVGSDGVVKVGQMVKAGDPLILATQPYDLKNRTGLAALRKSMRNQQVDRTVKWHEDHDGEVVAVHRAGDRITVHVKTVEPMQVGDKISARHGNKGVISMVLPDEHMPHDKEGKPVEIMLNPLGLPGRMNVGQLLETAAGKIAQKTGKTYVVDNFDPKHPDAYARITADLKKHGLSETEELIDPLTKKSLGQVTVGPQYMIKLVHQVAKKSQARAGMGLPGMHTEERIDSTTLQPASGGHGGGQSTGALGMFALLAHGATANIREMQTYKSEGEDPQTDPLKRWQSQHNEVWTAIQQGQPLPPPKTTFAFHRFTEMLKGAGINVEKKGHEMVLGPLTDKHILKMSAGELTSATRAVESKVDDNGDYKTIKGGLFDDKATGGHGGTKWSHVALAEPLPNPVFERAIQRVLDLKGKDYEAIVNGTKAVTHKGEIVGDLSMGKTGGAAIKEMLAKIDVPSALTAAKKDLTKAHPTDVDKALKKVKYLQALHQQGLKADEAYVLHNLPILPPNIRPISKMQEGVLKFEDINGLYMKWAQVNDQLKDPVLLRNLTDARKQELRAAHYDGVKALTGVIAPEKDDAPKGLLEQISGAQPKRGYYQATLVNRRQDLSMRSTIVPEPALGLDEVGLPRHEAFKIYMPFVIRQLVQQGTAPNALAAQKILSEHMQGIKSDKAVDIALETTMSNRPALLKRDPVLHKYGIQGFRPKVVEGSAIKIHPLACGGFNADFDGDHVLGRIIVFVAQRLMEVGISQGTVPATHGGVSDWPVASWWRQRRLPERLQNYYRNETSAPAGAFYVVDIAELPHAATSVERRTIEVHPVPRGLSVIAWNEQKRCPAIAEIQYWSSHQPRPVYVVQLEDGRQLVTDDDPRAVYGLDESNHHTRRRPAEATLRVPCLSPMSVGGGGEGMERLPLPNDEDMSLHTSMPLNEQTGYMFGAHVAGAYQTAGSLENRHFAMQLGRFDKVRVLKAIASTFLCEELAYKQAELTSSWPSVSVRNLLGDWVGYSLSERHLPAFFAYAPETFRIGMLEALIDALGRKMGDSAEGTIRCFNVRMGYEIVELLVGLGVAAYLESDSEGWRVRMGLAELAPLELELLPTKAELYKAIPAFDKTPEFVAGTIKVAKYHASNFSSRGYDITVPGFETFFDVHGVARSNTMAVFVPMTDAAVHEAHNMMPSKNILNEATGKVMFTPTLESALGLYKLSRVSGDSKMKFGTPAELLKAIDQKKLTVNDTVELNGVKTTGGRVMLADALPDSMRNSIMTKLDERIDKKGLNKMLETLNDKHKHEFAKYVDKIKDIGNAASFGIVQTPHLPDPVGIGTHTLKLKDFEPDTHRRDLALAGARIRVKQIYDDKKIPEADKERRAVQVYLQTDEKLVEEHLKETDKNPSALYLMHAAGTKPDKNQYKQMVIAPMILKNSKNEFIPTPVTKSYAEGLDLAGYWTQGHGARRGSVMKVQEVQEPGYMTKLLQNTSMHTLIDQHDCGTEHGLLLPIQERDVHDRHLAAPVKLGHTTIPAGTILTSDLVGKIRATDPNAKVLVRSPLKCDSDKGICKLCAGLNVNGEHHHIGTNIGVLSSHAVGERAVQLTLKSFHTGGVAELGGGSRALNSFARFEQLVKLEKKIPDAATLAMTSGKIDKIDDEATGVRVWVGGKAHFIGKDTKGLPLHQDLEGASSFKDYKHWTPPKIGQHVQAGESLSDPNRTTVNPHDLYQATKNIGVVQNHLADEIYSLYKDEHVRRRAIETMVRAMSNVSKVDDPGDHPDVLRGEFYPTSYINSLNRTDLKGKAPIVHAPVLKGVDTLPFVVSEDWMGHMQHQRLKRTLEEGAATQAVSKIHGSHPIPAVVFGAEIGKPNLAKPVPGRKFDVKPHHY